MSSKAKFAYAKISSKQKHFYQRFSCSTLSLKSLLKQRNSRLVSRPTTRSKLTTLFIFRPNILCTIV